MSSPLYMKSLSQNFVSTFYSFCDFFLVCFWSRKESNCTKHHIKSLSLTLSFVLIFSDEICAQLIYFPLSAYVFLKKREPAYEKVLIEESDILSDFLSLYFNLGVRGISASDSIYVCDFISSKINFF